MWVSEDARCAADRKTKHGRHEADQGTEGHRECPWHRAFKPRFKDQQRERNIGEADDDVADADD